MKLIAGAMADAVLEGRQGEQMEEASAEEEPGRRRVRFKKHLKIKEEENATWHLLHRM